VGKKNGKGTYPQRELVWLPLNCLHCDEEPREGETPEALTALRESIRRQRGILHPIIVADRKRCRIIAGRRRYRAAVLEQLERVPVLVAPDLSTAEQRLWVTLDENVARLPLSQAERLKLVEQLKPTYEAAAKARQQASQLAGKGKGGKPKKQGSVGGAKGASPKGKVTEHLGAAVGLSRETVRKALAVNIAAREHPELYGEIATRMLAGELAVDAAYKQMRSREADVRKADGVPEPPATPDDTPREPAAEAPLRSGDAASSGDAPGAVSPGEPQPEWVGTQYMLLRTRLRECRDNLRRLLADGNLTDQQLGNINSATTEFIDVLDPEVEARLGGLDDVTAPEAEPEPAPEPSGDEPH